jgi:hypothetical protein
MEGSIDGKNDGMIDGSFVESIDGLNDGIVKGVSKDIEEGLNGKIDDGSMEGDLKDEELIDGKIDVSLVVTVEGLSDEITEGLQDDNADETVGSCVEKEDGSKEVVTVGVSDKIMLGSPEGL